MKLWPLKSKKADNIEAIVTSQINSTCRPGFTRSHVKIQSPKNVDSKKKANKASTAKRRAKKYPRRTVNNLTSSFQIETLE